jgi:uncharacterized repeat protein (TIGR03803 family)
MSDSAGNLYGTTRYGGIRTFDPCSGSGCGTIFALTPGSNGSWSESVLYSFCQKPSGSLCLDGAFPEASLVVDSLGNLYGTTKAEVRNLLAVLGKGVVARRSNSPLRPRQAAYGQKRCYTIFAPQMASYVRTVTSQELR